MPQEDTPASVPPSGSRRAISQRTEHVQADAVTTTITDEDPRLHAFQEAVMGKVTQELRTTQLQIAEWQGTQMAGYEAVQHSLVATNQAITALTTQVTSLATQVAQVSAERSADATFIAEQKAEIAAKAHEAELIAARKEERAIIVLEQQKEKDKQDVIFREARKAAIAKRNRIGWICLPTELGGALSIGIYLITGAGQETTTSVAFAAMGIATLVLLAVATGLWIRPEAGV